MKTSDSTIIFWSKIKSITYNVYSGNKKYYVFNLKSSDANTGNSENLKFYVYHGVAETYGKLLKEFAIAN